MRVIAGDSEGPMVSRLEVTEAATFFLSRWRSGVRSVVTVSSVTPVVNLDGLVAVVGEGGLVKCGDIAASLRVRENSVMWVYVFLSMFSTLV